MPQQNVPLGVNVLLHILVVVQMIGGHVGDHRHLGAAAHGNQLEAGQLHHGHVLRAHIPQTGQQRVADVAAQQYLAAGGLHHFGDEGGGGGLAVRAGHRDDLARTVFKEQLHLAGDHHPGGQRRLQLRLGVIIAGGTHDDVLSGKPVGVMLAQTQRNVQAAQRVGVAAKILQRFFLVAEGHLRPHLHKLRDALFMADACADEGDLFAPDQGLQLFHWQHTILSFI